LVNNQTWLLNKKGKKEKRKKRGGLGRPGILGGWGQKPWLGIWFAPHPKRGGVFFWGGGRQKMANQGWVCCFFECPRPGGGQGGGGEKKTPKKKKKRENLVAVGVWFFFSRGLGGGCLSGQTPPTRVVQTSFCNKRGTVKKVNGAENFSFWGGGGFFWPPKKKNWVVGGPKKKKNKGPQPKKNKQRKENKKPQRKQKRGGGAKTPLFFCVGDTSENRVWSQKGHGPGGGVPPPGGGGTWTPRKKLTAPNPNMVPPPGTRKRKTLGQGAAGENLLSSVFWGPPHQKRHNARANPISPNPTPGRTKPLSQNGPTKNCGLVFSQRKIWGGGFVCLLEMLEKGRGQKQMATKKEKPRFLPTNHTEKKCNPPPPRAKRVPPPNQTKGKNFR